MVVVLCIFGHTSDLRKRLFQNIGNVILVVKSDTNLPHASILWRWDVLGSSSLPWYERANMEQIASGFDSQELSRAAAIETAWDVAATAYLNIGNDGLASRFFTVPRWQSHIVWGVIAARRANWSTALREYRTALSMQIGQSPTNVYPLMYESIRRQAEANYDKNVNDGNDYYLYGFYSRLLGDWKSASSAHTRFLAASGISRSAWENGQAHVTLGMVAEQTGDLHLAVNEYVSAVTFEPRLYEAWQRLIALEWDGLKPAERKQLQNTLGAMRPLFPIGRFINGNWAPGPSTESGGWTLDGFDVDREAVEEGGPVNITFYWDGESTRKAPEGWFHSGTYWLQRATVENLVPNSSFDWDPAGTGIPSGFIDAGYGAPPESYRLVVPDFLDSHRSNALILDNSQVASTGLTTVEFAVDPFAQYVQAGWMLTEGKGYLGRGCAGPEVVGAPWYIIAGGDQVAPGSWHAYATVSTPAEDAPVDRCQILLSNLGSNGYVAFDNLLFFRLPAIAVP